MIKNLDDETRGEGGREDEERKSVL